MRELEEGKESGRAIWLSVRVFEGLVSFIFVS